MLTLIETVPTTGTQLFHSLRIYGVRVEGEDLVFDTEPPPELLPALAVLHTAIRAVFALRLWYGERSDRPRLTVLNPAAPIPAGITLLCVEGDTKWDRIDPAARLELPTAFTVE